jgi:hypothetical protein
MGDALGERVAVDQAADPLAGTALNTVPAPRVKTPIIAAP